MEELSGLWTYRSFNPAYVTGDQTDQRERELIFADGFVFNFQTPTSTTLERTFGSPGGGFPLDLNGTVRPGVGGEPLSFDIVGTGRTGTETAGWEYRYDGHLTRNWSNAAADQRPFLVGSVIRAKPHGDRPAGSVYSFIAVKQQPPPITWELSGLWTYRSFYNWARYVYQTAPQIAQPQAHELILQNAVFNFKFETPTSTTLQGAIEWNVGHGPGLARGGGLDLNGTVRPGVGGEPSSFDIVGTGRTGTETAGWEYAYRGHLARNWYVPRPPSYTPPNGVDQRPALVGSVIRSKAHVQKAPDTSRSVEQAAPVGYVAPFIAVKQPLMTLNSPAFQPNGHTVSGLEGHFRIPSEYTCEGEDVSPPLAWVGVPNGTQSLVLIMDDPDAPDPNAPEAVWVHWVVYNIPPATKSLPKAAATHAGWSTSPPEGALLGRNDWAINVPQDPRATGYGGPCPPIGRHRYFHKLYALDMKLDPSSFGASGATKSQIERAMEGHVRAHAVLIGTYQKRA